MPLVTKQLRIRSPLEACVDVSDSLPMAISMAMAANVPARPWPLMKMLLYFWGSIPTRPNRLPCSTAPNADEGGKKGGAFLVASYHSNTSVSHIYIEAHWLTVDEPDSSHGDREEAVFLHGHFDQNRCEDEEQQDENKATCDTYRLRYPETHTVATQLTMKDLTDHKIYHRATVWVYVYSAPSGNRHPVRTTMCRSKSTSTHRRPLIGNKHPSVRAADIHEKFTWQII